MNLIEAAAIDRRRWLGAASEARILRRGPARAPSLRYDGIEMVGAGDRAGCEEMGVLPL
jgi:hypothetical protein